MLDFVIVTPTQMIDMRKELPADLESSVFVEADVGEGIVGGARLRARRQLEEGDFDLSRSIACLPQQ